MADFPRTATPAEVALLESDLSYTKQQLEKMLAEFDTSEDVDPDGTCKSFAGCYGCKVNGKWIITKCVA